MPLWSSSPYPFFTFSYTRGLSKLSCQISIYYEHYHARFLDLYFREFSAAINFPCSNSWLKIRVNTARIEIIITYSTAICTWKNKNFGPCIRAIFPTYSYNNFNPCGIFENMTSFSPVFIQELEQGKINGGRRFTEIKVQKTWVLYFVIDWNLARCPGKTYCVQKFKKNVYRKFDHRGSLKCLWNEK